MQIPIIIKNINIQIQNGDRIEERARQKRYEAIKSLMTNKTIMMTARHAEDQAETFLYQLHHLHKI